MAQKSRWSGDWFEVEVILLANIADKKVIKEVFDNAAPLPDYTDALDILAGFLQPDISLLKEKLPVCNAKDAPLPLYPDPTLPQAFPLKSIAEIEAEFPDVSVFERLLIDEQQRELEQAKQQSADILSDIESDVLPDGEITQLSDESGVLPENEHKVTSENEEHLESIEAPLKGLSEEERVMVERAEQRFSPIQLHYNTLTQPLETVWCTIPATDYDKLSVDSRLYSYQGYSVDVMPARVSKAENLFSNTPYIISEDSLKLKDVFRQMRRSRDFKPLLHVGWRQQVFEANKSTPVKLYAGENLTHHYHVAMSQFEREQQEEQASELALQQVLDQADVSADSKQPLTALQQKTLAKQQRLTEIFDGLAQFNSAQSVEAINVQASPLAYGDSNLTMASAPQPPIQPWHMDGFLDVFLIGNFLHIKADFSMVNLTMTEQATLNLTPGAKLDLKPIRLSQRRRMISRETHYLDHPYMGLIVQIRRHKRPEKPELGSNIE